MKFKEMSTTMPWTVKGGGRPDEPGDGEDDKGTGNAGPGKP